MQVCGITDACHGKCEVVDRAQDYISLPTVVTLGPNWKKDCQKALVK